MRKLFRSVSGAIFLMLTLVLWAEAQAPIPPPAPIYVDKDASCPGTGTTANPYCSIQNAFNALPSAASGHRVRIRDAASAYNENAVINGKSGISGDPLVIEPDTGHTPLLVNTNANAQQGAIEIRNSNFVSVIGLTFDGTGLQTSRHAVMAYNTAGPLMQGIVVTGNTFKAWGGTGNNTLDAEAVVLRPIFSSGFQNFPISGTISDNIFQDNRTHSIRLIKTDGVTISGNTITGQKCGLTAAGYMEAVGIKVSQDSTNTTITGWNKIHSHQAFSDCTDVTPTATNHVWAGIYADTGGVNSTIEQFEIHTIDPGVGSSTGPTGRDIAGIFLESRCDNWTVRNGIIRNIGEFGIRNGSTGTSDPDNNKFYNLTIINSERFGINVQRGSAIQIKNVVFQLNSGGAAPIDFDSPAVLAGGHDVDFNIYHFTGSTTVGRWNSDTALNFANWKTACNCDAHSLNTDPLLTATGNLTATSPGIDTGTTLAGIGANGAAPDIGAHEAIVIGPSSCTAGLAGLNMMDCDAENNRYSGLQSANAAAGWSVNAAGVNNPITAALITLNRIRFTLQTDFASGDSCSVTFDDTAGSITDSSGFTDRQTLLSFTAVVCINAIPGAGGGGAFPTVDAEGTSSQDLNTTTHTVVLPTCAAGKRYFVIFGVDGNPTLTWNWSGGTPTVVQSKTHNATLDSAFEARQFTSTGSDTLSLTSSAGEASVHIAWCIDGFHADTIAAGTVASDNTGTNGNADPPSLTPAWGALNTLWFAACMTRGTVVYSSQPSGYGNDLERDNGLVTSGLAVRAWRRNANIGTEDPSAAAFLTNGAEEWSCNTFAVRPTTGAPAVTPQRVARPRMF